MAKTVSARRSPSARLHTDRDSDGLLTSAGVDFPALDEEPSYLETGLWERGPQWAHGDAAAKLNPFLKIGERAIIVTDPVTELDAVFALSERMRRVLHRLALGADSYDELAPALRERLFAVGALHNSRVASSRRRAWRALLTKASDQFRRHGYVNLPRVLSPVHLAWLRQRYRRLVREALLAHGDSQCRTRWIAHNEPAARAIHPLLTPLVERVARVRVKPSYVYLGCYEAGSMLPEHTDREQCEYSITMLIDYLPEPNAESPWPIYLRAGAKPIAVRQFIGDALLYRGTRLPHFREVLPEGQMSSSLFFHFVPANFKGSLE